MERILFLTCTEPDGQLAKPAFEALAAAKNLQEGLAAPLSAGLVGDNVQSGADSIAQCGAEPIFAVAGVLFGQSRYATDAAALEALCRAAEATIIVAPAASRLSRVLPGVAHRLGGRIDTHATGVSVNNGVPQATRWYYRQRMEAVIERAQRPWIITTDPGGIAPLEGLAGTAAVEPVAVDVPDAWKRTEVEGIQAPPADEQTIRPDAEVLLVAGAGWTKKQADGQAHVQEAEQLIRDFLGLTQASLGGSKSMVDLAGEGQAVLPFMTHLHQVGQTGATPRHPKGLATCCHGEEPHVVGWRFINERRAVNLDPNCGWAHGKADVLYVADAFDVMAKVNALFSER